MESPFMPVPTPPLLQLSAQRHDGPACERLGDLGQAPERGQSPDADVARRREASFRRQRNTMDRCSLYAGLDSQVLSKLVDQPSSKRGQSA